MAVLVAALAAILLGTMSLATAAARAETRVGASGVAVEVVMGPPEHIAAGQWPGSHAVQPELVWRLSGLPQKQAADH